MPLAIDTAARRDNSKMIPGSDRKWLVRALGVTLGVIIMISSATPGRADDDDDDDPPDTKFFRSVLQGLGLRSRSDGVEYRERSPLVLPPSRDLPPPATSSAAAKNPAWPLDVDVKRRQAAKADRKKTSAQGDRVVEQLRPLRPSEFPRAGAPTASGSDGSRTSRVDPTAPMKPSELGYKGGLWSSIFNSNKEEYATFTGEAPRATLIEPPAGYRTPSPMQPYGVGRERYQATPVDRLMPQR